MPTDREQIKHLVEKATSDYRKDHGQFVVNNGDQEAVKEIMASRYMLEIKPAKQKRWNIKYWRY